MTTSAGGTGKTTEELQTPTDYTDSDPVTEDIYAEWNVDVDDNLNTGDPTTGGDDPWEFGTMSQYPMLKAAFEAPVVNEPPEISSGSRTEFSYRENGAASLYTYMATDPEGAAIAWSLSGADAGDFTINENGVLSFASPPDYENPTDAGSDNVYNVTVVVTDAGGLTDELDVTVTVTDQNEGPEVSGQESLSFPENQPTERISPPTRPGTRRTRPPPSRAGASAAPTAATSRSPRPASFRSRTSRTTTSPPTRGRTTSTASPCAPITAAPTGRWT